MDEGKKSTGFRKLVLFIICCAALRYILRFYVESFELPLDAFFSFEDHCKHLGYPYQTHHVTTDDGYILSMYRIGKEGQGINQGAPPVLLIHGLSNSAHCWIINRADKAPAFRLADEGFDVWLLNNRGSHLSRNHTIYSSEDERYWDWAFQDIVLSDVPAATAYLKQATGKDKYGLLGHSQGGGVILWYLALKPEVNDEVSLAILLGSAGGYVETESVYINLLTSSTMNKLMDYMGVTVVGDHDEDPFLAKLTLAFPSIFTRIGADLYDYKLYNDDPLHLSVYTHRLQGGTSLNNLKFYNRLISSKNSYPRLDDFGPTKNTRIYGSIQPPVVDFSKIRSKVAMMGGKHDRALKQGSLKDLAGILNPEVLVHYRDDLELDHGGFMISCNMSYFDDVVELYNRELRGKSLGL